MPLAGISRPARVADGLRASEVTFTPDELAELDRVFAPDAITGLRHPAFALKWAAR